MCGYLVGVLPISTARRVKVLIRTNTTSATLILAYFQECSDVEGAESATTVIKEFDNPLTVVCVPPTYE